MSLNIKNEEVHRLVRHLAELTGQSQTSVVEDAVRRRIAELERAGEVERRYQAIMELSDVTAALFTPEEKVLDLDQLLYDDQGLPK